MVIAKAALDLGAESVDMPVLGTQTPLALVGFTVAVVLVAAVCRIWSNHLLARSEADLSVELRVRFLKAQAQAEYGVQTRHDIGDSTAHLGTNTGRVVTVVVTVINAIAATITVALMLAAGSLVNAVALIAIGSGGAILYFVFRPLRARARTAATQTTEANRRSVLAALELILNGVEVKTSGREASVLRRVDEAIETLREPAFRSSTIRRAITTMQIHVLLLLSVVWIGVLDVVGNNDITQVGAVALVALRALQLSTPLQGIMHTLDDAGPYVADLHARITEYEAAVPPVDRTGFDRLESLQLSGIEYRYDTNDGAALRAVDLTIRRGDAIAVVGPSGSGKSTLARILLGMLRPDAGEILVNGEAANLASTGWDKLSAFVPQESRLFTATLRENITLFDSSIGDDAVHRAVDRANLRDVVDGLDLGLDEVVGDRGVRNLSGGQRQRVSLARALVTDPELLVLDEPTSALDPASEEALSIALDAVRHEVTTVIIAHRFATIARCDKVVVLDAGQVVAAGTLDDVASRNHYLESLRFAR